MRSRITLRTQRTTATAEMARIARRPPSCCWGVPGSFFWTAGAISCAGAPAGVLPAVPAVLAGAELPPPTAAPAELDVMDRGAVEDEVEVVAVVRDAVELVLGAGALVAAVGAGVAVGRAVGVGEIGAVGRGDGAAVGVGEGAGGGLPLASAPRGRSHRIRAAAAATRA